VLLVGFCLVDERFANFFSDCPRHKSSIKVSAPMHHSLADSSAAGTLVPRTFHKSFVTLP
jgi:hypothetical protein